MVAQGNLEPAGNTSEYSRAFLVGWRLAQLYANPTHIDHKLAFVVDEEGYLPGISQELTQQQQAQLIWVGLQTDLSELPGGISPEATAAKTALGVSLASANYHEESIASGILDVFKVTSANVYVVNPHLAKALNLGRELAGLVFGSVGASPDLSALRKQLSAGRVGRICSLLDELRSAFPLRATDAVSGSLQCWRRWMETGTDADAVVVRSNLRSQGERWRSLLTGEIRADDLLDLHDYRQAIRNYVGQVAGLYQKSPWLSGTVLVMLIATGASIWAIVTYAPKGAAVVAAIIATVAGALGITWKTVSVTVGKAAALIERPMFDKQISEAVKIAAFLPPVEMTAAVKAKLLKELREKDEQQVMGTRPVIEPVKSAVVRSDGQATLQPAASRDGNQA